MIRPLQGIRVISLAQQLPGPFAGMLLADLGAEVILVEQPNGGDPARQLPNFFEAFNRGKKSVMLDLKSDEGKTKFLALAKTARVILEGFRPGVAERLGVDYESVREHREDVIYCSISGYGQDTGERLLPGHDISYQARAGGVQMTEDGFSHPAYATADLSSAMYAALAVSSAAHGPDSCYLDVSMSDSVLSWRIPALARSEGEGSGSAGWPAYGIFQTQDASISLSIAHEDHFWKSLCAVLAMEDLADRDNAARATEVDALRDRITSALSQMSTEEALSQLAHAGVPAGRVNDDSSVITDRMFQARGMIRADGGHVEVRTPLSRLQQGPPDPAPALGEHTDAVLREAGASV